MEQTDDSSSAGRGSGKTAGPVSTAGNEKSAQTDPPGNDRGSKNPKKTIIIILIVLIVGGLIGFFLMRHKPEGKPGWLRVSGRLEGYETNVGAKIAGRVE